MKKVMYYLCITPYGDSIVRVVYLDGTTRDWHKVDHNNNGRPTLGYKSARAKAMRQNENQMY